MFSVSWYHHPHNSAPPNTQNPNQEDARSWTQKIKKKEKQEEEQNLKTIPAWVGGQVPLKSFEIFSEAEIAEMSQRIWKESVS
jgi:hypothetical protein